MNSSTNGNMHKDSVSSLSSQFPLKTLWTDSIESHYKIGLGYYEQLLKPIESQLADTESAERESQRVWAIEYLKKSLLYVGNYEQQLIKIKSFLLLVKIYEGESEWELRESCFYGAVEIVRNYIGDNFQNSSFWIDIIGTYLLVIDPSSKDIGMEKAYKLIMYESEQRRQANISKTQDAQFYLKNATTDEIIDKLEEVLWPVRLVIVWKDSWEVLVNHRFVGFQMEHWGERPPQSYEMVVDIFGMPRQYLISIDHWGTETSNQIKKYEWSNIVKPILEFYIKKKENYFFTCSSENALTIECAEMNMEIPQETNDYRYFLSLVLSYPQYLWEFHETRDEFIDYFLQAVDICRIITLVQQTSREKLAEEIDRILGRKIKRRVLQMVKSMILSHNETMNGSGSPFWVSKRNIPLEWRLYSIIRDYEALVTLQPWGISPETVISRMGEWAKGGYFEEHIFKIFSESVDQSGLFQKKLPRSIDNSFLSKRRKARYSSHISSWYRIIELSKNIELQYAEGRFSSADENLQKISFEKANVLTQELMREANMRSITASTRHGKTKSDQGKIDITSNDALLSPGSKTEPLAAEWEETSRNIWEKCQWLKMEIYSGNLPRAYKTAELIREGVMMNVHRTISDAQNMLCSDVFLCPIRTESSLTNPDKSLEGFWKKKTRSRLSAIILDENTKWLAVLLESLASPLKESTSLLVTHGHPANIIDALLENFTRQDGFSSKKSSMKNGEVSAFLLQWNGVSREGDSTTGLFFPFTDWKAVLLEINNLSRNVFGEIFYSPAGRLTDLIALHDEFLDFIDDRSERSPGKLAVFIKMLEENPITAHFPEILRTAGVLE